MNKGNFIKYIFLFLMIAFWGCQSASFNKNDDIEFRIDNLLPKMTIEEKVGQMTQIAIDVVSVTENGALKMPQAIDTAKLAKAINNYKVGSILNVAGHAYTREHWLEIMKSISVSTQKNNLKIPVLYGIDAIHGVNYTIGSTLFPQEIALAATWNPKLAEEAASITAYETRASYIPWNFSPVLDLGRMPVWPRLWETFGEDVFLAKTMGKAMITGYEGNNIADKYKVASCLKHYMGYSFPLNGKDRTPAWIPERYIREYFLPTFEEAIKTGAHTVMVNSAEINGIPVHADYHILTEILKNELNFRGFVVSDWEDIKNLYSKHHIALNDKEAVKLSVMAGIDMSMVPLDYSFADYLIELVKEGQVPESRINDAVRRILRVKYQLGLFDTLYYNAKDYSKFGSEEFRNSSQIAASEAITLLKNQNGLLPIAKNKKVLVTGITANSMACLNGGWSYTWQGTETDQFTKNKFNILQAINKKIGAANVKSVLDSTFNSPAKIQEAVNVAKLSDYIILCLGEYAYCETPGNIDDLYLPDGQTQLALELAKTGKPVILVLAEGRPRIISKFENKMQSIIMAYLPGNEGGLAIADVIFGDVNPSGKLPFSYPRYPNALLCYDHKYTETSDNRAYNPQYPFGYGLSYTKFEYSNLKLNTTEITGKDTIVITVDVSNTGKRKGKEVIQLYISDLYASITPPVKRLRGFEKIELSPSETKTVTFKITKEMLAFVGKADKWVTEPGDFELRIDKLTQKFVVR